MQALLIDFGSTFTKTMVVDLHQNKILKRAYSPSTVDTDVTVGLKNALQQIGLRITDLQKRKFTYQLSSSSAAGGLKIVALGLVPELTVEAAKEAALGAGGNVVGTYAYELNPKELGEIEQRNPDIILLAGGCDGGDKKTVLHNAKVLAQSKLHSPIIISCNKTVSRKVEKILNDQGKNTMITENVMPELWNLNTEPVKKEIRRVFLQRIVKAKGLDKVRSFLDNVIPTPTATMKAAELLAEGIENTKGVGELLVIEVGGATTNVYSISEGIPTRPNVTILGFKEPYIKRTVEGDLGMRHNAVNIIDKIGEREFKKILVKKQSNARIDVYNKARNLARNVSFIPRTKEDKIFDCTLAQVVVRLGVERHTGYLTELALPAGVSYIQKGKDLSSVKTVLGSGGGIIWSINPHQILSEAKYNAQQKLILKPKKPKLCIDKDYVLWSMGLLSSVAPQTAFTIMKKSMVAV